MTVGQRFARVVIKLSGEALGPPSAADAPERMRESVKQLSALHDLGLQIVVIVGGGNYFRGNQRHLWGLEAADADDLGMYATGMNAKFLKGLLVAEGLSARIFGRGPCSHIESSYNQGELTEAITKGSVGIIAGGMGFSGVSTDVAAVHTAVDIDADAVLMSKYNVDGVYSADPRHEPSAEFLPFVDASDAIRRGLQIVDLSALVLALEHNKVIHIFSAADRDAMSEVVLGRDVGSVICPK